MHLAYKLCVRAPGCTSGASLFKGISGAVGRRLVCGAALVGGIGTGGGAGIVGLVVRWFRRVWSR